jgi:hypothetical protein
MITLLHGGKYLELFYRHNHIMVNAFLFLRHIYREHLYNLACHHSRVLHELGRLLFGTGHREALAYHIQVGSGVEGL